MRPPAGAIGAVVALLVAMLAGAATHKHSHREAAQTTTTTTASPPPSVLSQPLPRAPAQLAADIDSAQQIIDDPSSPSDLVASAGRFDQLAMGDLERERPKTQRAVLGMLSGRAATTMRANLAAAAALSRLATPRKRLPPWKIIQPPTPATLLRYFKLAQARFGIRWQYLAAVEFIETKFGRIRGPSTAGAQGPMQFLPSTWARYGSGDINNPRDAILGAARYLRASGAPGDMAGALYHYNPSQYYVAAVNDYASVLRADSRAYYGYYNWQVLYRYARGLVILPVGYPKARPAPVRYPS
jgi:membrane-bound lytic murein transglycosylase B